MMKYSVLHYVLLELYREGQLNCENVLAIICGRRMKPGRRGTRKGSLGTERDIPQQIYNTNGRK